MSADKAFSYKDSIHFIKDQDDIMTVKQNMFGFELNLRMVMAHQIGEKDLKLPKHDFFIDSLFYDVRSEIVKDPTYKGLDHLEKGSLQLID